MNFESLFARLAPEQRDKARRQDTLVATDGVVDPDLLATQLCEQSLSDEATLPISLAQSGFQTVEDGSPRRRAGATLYGFRTTVT